MEKLLFEDQVALLEEAEKNSPGTVASFLAQVRDDPSLGEFILNVGEETKISLTFPALVATAINLGIETPDSLKQQFNVAQIAQITALFAADQKKLAAQIELARATVWDRLKLIKPQISAERIVSSAGVPAPITTRSGSSKEPETLPEAPIKDKSIRFDPTEGVVRGENAGESLAQKNARARQYRGVVKPEDMLRNFWGGVRTGLTGQLFGAKAGQELGGVGGVERFEEVGNGPKSASVARAERTAKSSRAIIARTELPVNDNRPSKGQLGLENKTAVEDRAIREEGGKANSDTKINAAEALNIALEFFGGVSRTITPAVKNMASWIQVNVSKATAGKGPAVIVGAVGAALGFVGGGVPGAVGVGLASGLFGQSLSDQTQKESSVGQARQGIFSFLDVFANPTRSGVFRSVTWPVLVAFIFSIGTTLFIAGFVLMPAFVDEPLPKAPVAADTEAEINSVLKTVSSLDQKTITNDAAKKLTSLGFTVKPKVTDQKLMAGVEYTDKIAIYNASGKIYDNGPMGQPLNSLTYNLDLSDIAKTVDISDSVLVNTVIMTLSDGTSRTATETIQIGKAPSTFFSCPVIGGVVSCVSSSGPSTTSCHHCDKEYTSTPTGAAACTWEGNEMAMDVKGQQGQEVFLPALKDKEVVWNFVSLGEDKEFTSNRITQQFAIYTANVGGLVYTLQLHHLTSGSIVNKQNLKSGTAVATLAGFDGNKSSPHTHIQLKVGEGWVPAENYLCK